MGKSVATAGNVSLAPSGGTTARPASSVHCSALYRVCQRRTDNRKLLCDSLPVETKSMLHEDKHTLLIKSRNFKHLHSLYAVIITRA